MSSLKASLAIPTPNIGNFIVALIGAVTNGLLLLSLFWRYEYSKSSFSSNVSDMSWWNTLAPHSLFGVVLLLLIVSPVLISLGAFLLSFVLSFNKNWDWSGIEIAGMITTVCLSTMGLIVSIVVNIITYGLVFIQTLNYGTISVPPSDPDYASSYAVYGPAFCYVPLGFLISLACSIILQVLLMCTHKKPSHARHLYR
jgi:hypothetical protein